jgi:hypothetical protein
MTTGSFVVFDWKILAASCDVFGGVYLPELLWNTEVLTAFQSDSW